MLLVQLLESNKFKTYRNFNIPVAGMQILSIPSIKSINLWCFYSYCSLTKCTRKKMGGILFLKRGLLENMSK